MRLKIDNFDGVGVRDYTAALATDKKIRIIRRINRPNELELHLVSNGPNFVVPADGGAAPKRVTDAWSGDLDLDELATADLIHYPTFDGREIPAFVYKPRGHRADGSSPALFYVDGDSNLSRRNPNQPELPLRSVREAEAQR